MTNVLGIAGSLRSGSWNAALLRAAAAHMPAGATLEIGSIQGIPLYDGDVETASGVPPPVARLKDQIAAAEGVLIVTPEYNNSIPGVLKNAIDWCSRPDSDSPRVFRGRKIALIGASPSAFGTTLAQAAWLPVLRTLGTNPWFGARLLVSRAQTAFDASGDLVDDRVRDRLRAFLEGFVAFVRDR